MRMNATRVLFVLWAWTLLNETVLALTSDEANTISAHDRVAGSCVLVFVKAQGLRAEDATAEKLVTGSGFAGGHRRIALRGKEYTLGGDITSQSMAGRSWVPTTSALGS